MDESFTVAYKEGSGTGIYQTADGFYPYLFVDSASENYWNSDPTLALLHEWVVAGTGFDEFDTSPTSTTNSTEQNPGETDEDFKARQQQRLTQTIAASEQARQAYLEAFDQQASDADQFASWLRDLYIRGYEAAGRAPVLRKARGDGNLCRWVNADAAVQDFACRELPGRVARTIRCPMCP